MSINRGLFVVFVAATIAITAFGVATSAGGVRSISADNSESVVTRTYTPGDPSPVTIQTTSALLAHPVYNTDVQVYGQVGGLGELFCPCFAVTSGGNSVDVWLTLVELATNDKQRESFRREAEKVMRRQHRDRAT